MKHFKLNGDTAYWKHGLNFDVLNLNTLETDATSPIPSDKRMWVNVVSNLYKVEGKEREVLKMDCWRALTELDAKAKDYEDMRKTAKP